MLGFNHVAGGITITGIGASLFDVNLFSKPEYLLITWLASILPDIDHTKSVVGKCAYPLAKYIDRNFGHRTITHSLVCWLGLTVVMYLGEQLLFKSEVHTWIFSLAYFSHLLLDMCTLQGIPLFYPFSSDMCVLPANPKLRVQTNDLKSEILIFFGFCILLISMLDLISAGLTPSYNSSFRSFTHLHKQAKQSSKAFKITYIDATSEKNNGIVIETETDKALVYTKNSFMEIKKKDCQITEIKPTSTTHEIITYKFVDIEKDSLEKIIEIGPILSLEFTATQSIIYFEKDLQKVGKSVKIERIKEFTFNFAKNTNKDTSTAPILLQIEKLQNQIKIAQQKYHAKLSERQILASEEQNLQIRIVKMDNYEKTKAIQRLKELRKELEKESPEPPNTENQQAEIAYLQKKLLQKTEIQTLPTFTGKCKIWKSYKKMF